MGETENRGVFNHNNMSDYNKQLVQRFRNADKEFQDNDCFLYGLFELARTYGAINAQEKTIKKAKQWIKDNYWTCSSAEEYSEDFVKFMEE